MKYILDKPFFVLGAFVLLLVAVLAVATVRTAHAASSTPKSGERLLVIHDDEGRRGFLTKAATVKEALKEANVPLDTNDLVEPKLDEELVASSYDINIYRARPVTIIDGSIRKKVMSAYRTPAQIAKHADMELRSEDLTNMGLSVSSGGVVTELTITRATPLTLVLYGKSTTVYTQADSVAGLLKEKDIRLGEHDKLSTDPTTKITEGMTLELWREGRQTITQDEGVQFNVEKIQDVDRPAGYREVRTPGEIGRRTVTYEIEIKNGVEVSRTEIASVTTKEPRTQVEVIGAKFNYTGGPLNEEQITALGMCESGMTATRNSGNGFYGAFQFMPATWRSAAPDEYKHVMPHEAPLEAQKQAVQNLLSRSSIYTQFPACARKMSAQGIL